MNVNALFLSAVFFFQINWILSISQDAALNTNKNKCSEHFNSETNLQKCNETTSLVKCANETDCDEDSSCCFDGCDRFCARNVTGLREIDWEVEPSFDFAPSDSSAIRSGSSANRAANHPVVICTTTFDHPPSLAIGCNAGYSCKPEGGKDQDDREVLTKKGICVPDEDNAKSTRNRTADITTKTDFKGGMRTTETAMLEERTGEKTVFLPGGCFLTKEEYNDVEELKNKTYVINCTCIAGSVECQFNKENPNQE